MKILLNRKAVVIDTFSHVSLFLADLNNLPLYKMQLHHVSSKEYLILSL